jgi:hypothetical protein
MNWLAVLGIFLLVSAVLAVTAIKPRGTRPVASTRLLAIGRIVLLVVAAVLFYFWLTNRAGH